MGESAPFWRFSASSYPDLEGEIPENTFVETRTKTLNSESDASVGVGISITFACNLFFLVVQAWQIFLGCVYEGVKYKVGL